MTENTKITAALIKLQGDLKNVPMDSTNPFFKNSKYASLLSVRETIQKPLADAKLAVTQTYRMDGGQLLLDTTLRHESGETINSVFPISGTTPQQQGSATTYARRYSLLAMLNLVGDPDDDGNEASAPEPFRASQRGQRPAQPAPGQPRQKTLLERAETVAQTGLAKLDDWWGSLTPAELKTLDSHLENLTAQAKEADAERKHIRGERKHIRGE
jgi:hypothetical protein